MPIKDHVLPILLIAIAIFTVYCNSINSAFIWDDSAFIVENTAIRCLSPKSILSIFTDRSTISSNELLSRDVWRPLVALSFATDYSLWKLNPIFYHLENVILHIANAILVYALTLFVVGNFVVALAAALVFSVHPVQAEAVTWISGRSNVLFLLFFLLSILFHIKNRNDANVKPSNYNLSIVFFFLSLLSKEMAITLPLILIAYDAHFHPGKDMRSYLRYYFAFFLIAFFYLLARLSVLGVIAQRHEWWGGSLASHVLVIIKSIFMYLQLLVFPVNPKLEYIFGVPKLLSPEILCAISGLAVVALVYYLFRKEKTASFYFCWFFITLIPVSNIIPFKAVMAGRFLYLPSIAFAALIGLAFLRLLARFQSRDAITFLLKLAFLALLLFYGASTISRNMEWADEITLYKNEVKRSPENPRFHYNLALAYAKEAKRPATKSIAFSRYALAIKEFKEAIRLNPRFQWAYINLGSVYNDMGLYSIAIEHFSQALTIEENYIVYNNLGAAYYNKGRFDKALKFCRLSLSLKPDYPDAYVNMGKAYFANDEYVKAKKAWIYAMKLGDTNKAVKNAIEGLQRMGY